MAITKFDGQYAFLSNFFECSILYNGILYYSAECAFQAQKTLDEIERRTISMLQPGKAKRAGRKVNLRPDWNEVRQQEMYNIVLAKFSQNSKLTGLLLSTGNEELIEGNYWHDNFWGNCSCAKCASNSGLNNLGKTLMQVRDVLRAATMN